MGSIAIQRVVIASPGLGEPCGVNAAGKCDVGVCVEQREARRDRAHCGMPIEEEELCTCTVVRGSQRTDLAVGPWLTNDPVDNLCTVADFVWRPLASPAPVRCARAAHIDIHPSVAVGHKPLSTLGGGRYVLECSASHQLSQWQAKLHRAVVTSLVQDGGQPRGTLRGQRHPEVY